MFKRIFIASLLIVSFSLLQSCGTILKYKSITAPKTKKIDYLVVALDGIATVLFVLPGVIAFTVDYATGTLFITDVAPIKLQDTSNDSIKSALTNAGVSTEGLDNALSNPVNVNAQNVENQENSTK